MKHVKLLTMETYRKYLPISSEDKDWGLYTLNVGYGEISNNSKYPGDDHPTSYHFNWKNGRVLSEYQLIYITQGEGFFESESAGEAEIREGTIIMLFPDEWHRYKENKGWNEHWVGFNGPIADRLFRNNFFRPHEPIIHVGLRDELIRLFNGIAERTKTELSGYQPLISGKILHLLGFIHAIRKESRWGDRNDGTPPLIDQARVIFRENTETNITVEQVAEQLGVSYSLFRKVFKKYTGISPGQYLIQLKMEKAKLLLTFPNKLVKEVAYELGFDSCFYFSNLFKEKTGLSPADYREKYMRQFRH